jgi:hypothetical protein
MMTTTTAPRSDDGPATGTLRVLEYGQLNRRDPNAWHRLPDLAAPDPAIPSDDGRTWVREGAGPLVPVLTGAYLEWTPVCVAITGPGGIDHGNPIGGAFYSRALARLALLGIATTREQANAAAPEAVPMRAEGAVR